MDELFGQVPRAVREGASGPELSGHFDIVDSGVGYKKLHTLGVPNGTPFAFSVKNVASLYRQRQAPRAV